MALLEIRNLTVNVGDKTILKNISLDIEKGETHVLMGPNGAGKSTLGNAIMGNENYMVESGEIRFNGEDIVSDSVTDRAKKGIFLSFQNPIEVPGITLSNFIRNAKDEVTGKKNRIWAFRKELEEKMKLLNMDKSYADRDLNVGFSGGEKKKSEILQMLMLNPLLAILDETDSGLDVDAVRTVSEGVRDFQEKGEGALLIITHSTRILEALRVDKTHVLVNGNIVKSGANVVLSKLPIGDLATQYFADRDVFCAGRVAAEDIERVAKATGACLLQTCNDITEKSLGTCGIFEERQIGAERFNLFQECPKSKTATIIIRGGAEQFIEEAERSMNDAIMIVRRASKATSIVAGGGAIEMELSKYVRNEGMKISGKEQFVVLGFARALEIIPKTLAQNSALDAIEVMNKLRQKHNKEDDCKFGVNCFDGGIIDTYINYVWEPTILKENVLNSATEAACTIISVDQTVKNPKSEQAIQDQKKRQMQRANKLKAAKK